LVRHYYSDENPWVFLDIRVVSGFEVFTMVSGIPGFFVTSKNTKDKKA
jgi:hypothetical protein